MVSEISLGTFNTQNGKNVVTGGASKLDTTAIINALATAKAAPATRLTTANTTLDKQTAALNQMNTLFTTLETAADSLRNPPGVNVDSQNIFSYRTATITDNTGSDASNYVSVSVQPGAEAQSYTIDSVTKLAYQTKQQTGVFSVADSTNASAVSATSTAGLFTAGTVNIRAVDGTVGGVPITLAAGDSLETVANKFNEVSSRTGIQATVLQVATGSYKLILSATQTGTTYGFDLNKTAPAASAGIVSDPSGVFSQIGTIATPQPAQDAVFSLDGVSITRQSNSISDVLDDVTFTLKQPSPPSVLNVSVQPDTSIVAKAITQFADAYNAFKLFASNQMQLDDSGQPKDTSVLYNNTTFRTIEDEVNSEASRVVAGITGSNPAQLSDLGITLDDFAGDETNPATKNIMTVNTDQLNSLLLSNFNGVAQAFEYQETSDNSNFVNSARSNNLSISSFTVNISQSTNTYTASYVDANGATQTIPLTGAAIQGGGLSLTGQAGTIFAGSTYVFASSADATVHVTVTQGFGDRFYNLADSITNTTDGSITNELSSISDQKSRNTDKINTINDQVSTYRDQLSTQYANLESAISSANSILDLLDAQANANKSS